MHTFDHLLMLKLYDFTQEKVTFGRGAHCSEEHVGSNVCAKGITFMKNTINFKCKITVLYNIPLYLNYHI